MLLKREGFAGLSGRQVRSQQSRSDGRQWARAGSLAPVGGIASEAVASNGMKRLPAKPVQIEIRT
jgi:hypothetical protein